MSLQWNICGRHFWILFKVFHEQCMIHGCKNGFLELWSKRYHAVKQRRVIVTCGKKLYNYAQTETWNLTSINFWHPPGVFMISIQRTGGFLFTVSVNQFSSVIPIIKAVSSKLPHNLIMLIRTTPLGMFPYVLREYMSTHFCDSMLKDRQNRRQTDEQRWKH